MKKRKIKHQKFWIFFIFALILGLVLGNVFSNAITGKGILNQIMGISEEKIGYKNEVSQEYEYSSTQRISVSEAYKQFKDNLPESLRQKMEEIGLDLSYPPYPIGCIDYEDMDGEWEIFKDLNGIWRANYLGPYPTQIKPYYVMTLDGVWGSPVELWPEDLSYPVQFWIDGCEVHIFYGPTCKHLEAHCVDNVQSSSAHAWIYCTGNCTGNYTHGFEGCFGNLWKGRCNYPWEENFGIPENPLIS